MLIWFWLPFKALNNSQYTVHHMQSNPKYTPMLVLSVCGGRAEGRTRVLHVFQHTSLNYLHKGKESNLQPLVLETSALPIELPMCVLITPKIEICLYFLFFPSSGIFDGNLNIKQHISLFLSK